MELLSSGITSSLDQLYLITMNDGTQYVVDEVYSGSEYNFYSNAKVDSAEWMTHMLWYRHGTTNEVEWEQAECRIFGIHGDKVASMTPLEPYVNDIPLVDLPIGLYVPV